MKKTFITFILCLSATLLSAGIVNNGVYRIVNAGNSTVVTEDVQTDRKSVV